MRRLLEIYPISIEPMEEGGYFATCPLLQGCHAEGETFAEAISNSLRCPMSNRFPVCNYKDIAKLAKRLGFVLYRQAKGSHEVKGPKAQDD